MKIFIDLLSIKLKPENFIQLAMMEITINYFSSTMLDTMDENNIIIINPEFKWQEINKHCKGQTDFSIITNDFNSHEDLWPNIVLNHNDILTLDSLSISMSIVSNDLAHQPRTFVMSDIHGCFDQFNAMIKLINFQPRDKFICLGDLIDRGPKSKQVVQLCIDLPGDNLFIKGNHEEMLLNFLAQPSIWQNIYLKPINGGNATFDSYLGDDNIIDFPDDHVEFIENMSETFIEHDDFIFVHAGLNPIFDLKKQTPEDCRWIRNEFLYHLKPWPKKVIHGHTPTEFYKIDFQRNRIGIDCGCIFGGNLACLELNNMKEYYIPNLNCSDIT